MKNKLLLFACLILCKASVTDAQSFESIFSHGAGASEWVIIWGNTWGFRNDTVYVEKDTLLNGYDYKKVRIKSNVARGGLLREDTNTGEVWFRDIALCADTIERLVFDFSLQEGDTFREIGRASCRERVCQYV